MENRKNNKKKKVIDLRRFIQPEMEVIDENGSYTGLTSEMVYRGEKEQPIQDADDL